MNRLQLRRLGVAFAFAFATLAFAVPGPAEPPSAAPPPASPPAAAPPASAPATPGVPLGRWLVVREATGKALKVGAGVRFRAGGYDTAQAGKGSAIDIACTASEARLTCDDGLTATADAGAVRVTLGPIALTLANASDAEAKQFGTWLDDTLAQQKTCRAAAACCRAAEPILGTPCKLESVLGDRTLASCRGGLASLRAALTAKKAALPEACKEGGG